MKKIETERKYIIEKPDINNIMSSRGFTSSEITQIYLSDSEKTHRIRKRVFSDGTVEYTENTKMRISLMSSVESEREISENEFLKLSEGIEAGSHPIKKTRLTFEYMSKIFEIDIYPEWKKTCILEVELQGEGEDIDFPNFIKIISDVTGKREYSNHRMAFEFPNET